MNVVLFPHMKGSQAEKVARKLCDALYRNGMKIYVDPANQDFLADLSFLQFVPFAEAIAEADIAVAIGGDGTMLHCARHIVDNNVKIMGINTGTLGFLASMEPDQIGEVARLQTGDYRVSERMLLDGKIYNPQKEIVNQFTALNDIVVSRNYSRVMELTVAHNGTPLGYYRADGILFSTPTGSTAYALSTGGPIIEPEFSCIEMNLICPHALAARPMLFSPSSVLEVSYKLRGEVDVYLSYDGVNPVEFPADHTLEITRSEKTIQLLDLSGNTFFDSLSNKMMQTLKDGRGGCI